MPLQVTATLKRRNDWITCFSLFLGLSVEGTLFKSSVAKQLSYASLAPRKYHLDGVLAVSHLKQNKYIQNNTLINKVFLR